MKEIISRRLAAGLAAGCVLSLLAAAPSTSGGETKHSRKAPYRIFSAAFQENDTIPRRFTCEGENVSPPLSWTGLPRLAKSLVLIVEDPDAPDPAAPKMTWVHWILYNIPPTCSGLAEGVVKKDLPPGTREGMSDFKRTGWGGPCPPIGRHRYFFWLLSLDTVLPDLDKPDRATLEKAMSGHVVGRTSFLGTYQKEVK